MADRHTVIRGSQIRNLSITGTDIEDSSITESKLNLSGLTISGALTLNTGTSVNEFSVDGTLSGNSDNTVPTEKAIKTYVDTVSGVLDSNKDDYLNWVFAVDGVTKDPITSGDVLNFVGGDNITITRSGDDEITISGAAGGGGGIDTSGTPQDNDYAKFTDSDTVEGRSYSEVLSDLSGEATGAFSWNSQNLTTLGNVLLNDGSYIGQAAGGQILFDDTNNFIEINGANVSIGGTGNSEALLEVIDSTLETTASYYGIKNTFVKTGGVTDSSDNLYGIYNNAGLDQIGGSVGELIGSFNGVEVDAGTVVTAIMATYSSLQLDGGTFSNPYGLYTEVDIDAAVTSIAGSVFGHYIWADVDTAPDESVFMLYLYEGSNVDYGIYQNGTALNVFGGDVQTPTVRCSDLTDGYLPYHVSDASGLANSDLYHDGSRFMFHHTASVPAAWGNEPYVQFHQYENVGIYKWANNEYAATLYFSKSRSGTIGTAGTAVQDNDALGVIIWSGDDGTDLQQPSAMFGAYVDGAVAGNQVPARFYFSASDTGGTLRDLLTLAAGADGHTVFNESGQDIDFRIEASGETHALFVQGSDGKVGIGMTPSSELDVDGTVESESVKVDDTSHNEKFEIVYNSTTDSLDFDFIG